MAGDWIKMRGNLWDDPRVAKIVDMTDSSEATVIGALYWLWATADQHTEDGIMPGLTLRAIDRKTGVKGFAEALCAIGWLADHPDGVRIIDFEKHNGSSAKKRCQTAKRVANFAAANAQNNKPEPDTNADGVSSALAREREEKRREDKKEEGRARATRIPADFEPKPEAEAEQGIDRQKELANFRDYWTAKSRDNTKLDWQATWRQWARKADRPGVSRFPDKNAVPPVSTVWHESAAGVAQKASELRLTPQGDTESHPAFKSRVQAAIGRPALGFNQLAAMAQQRQAA